MSIWRFWTPAVIAAVVAPSTAAFDVRDATISLFATDDATVSLPETADATISIKETDDATV